MVSAGNRRNAVSNKARQPRASFKFIRIVPNYPERLCLGCVTINYPFSPIARAKGGCYASRNWESTSGQIHLASRPVFSAHLRQGFWHAHGERDLLCLHHNPICQICTTATIWSSQ